MIRIRPSCDRHKNLQMIPFSIKHPTGKISHACPVPSCNRHHDNEGYFDMVDDKPVREEDTSRNRIASARDEIMRAIGAKNRSVPAVGPQDDRVRGS